MEMAVCGIALGFFCATTTGTLISFDCSLAVVVGFAAALSPFSLAGTVLLAAGFLTAVVAAAGDEAFADELSVAVALDEGDDSFVSVAGVTLALRAQAGGTDLFTVSRRSFSHGGRLFTGIMYRLESGWALVSQVGDNLKLALVASDSRSIVCGTVF